MSSYQQVGDSGRAVDDIDEESMGGSGKSESSHSPQTSVSFGTLMRTYWRRILMATMLVAVILITVIVIARGAGEDSSEWPRNVILLIPDGTGFASLTMARVCKGSSLTLDSILRGSIRTYSSDSWVTDSAASATAYASGEKTYNGAIGVDKNQLPIGTLHEAAKRRGMVAGMVATSRITHATPAAFSSHAGSRADEGDIALQQITKRLDFAFGGGARYYLPNRRKDGRDLVANLTHNGYSVVLNRSSFDAWSTHAMSGSNAFPVFGLLADDHMEYEIDRAQVGDQPSLTQILTPLFEQLGIAARRGGPGFITMIEGSRVDHAGHTNDPSAHMREALEFDAAVAAALEFRKRFPETIVISVADHETGGLGLGRDNQYFWWPQILNNITSSTDRLADLLQTSANIATTIYDYTHITLTASENNLLNGIVNGTIVSEVSLSSTIGHIISERAGISWTTLGHTGMDIGLYAAGPDDWMTLLSSVHENTDINKIIAEYLSLDLDAVTRELRQ